MAYRHGAFVQEQATAFVAVQEVDSALPVVVGTAPVHNLAEGSHVPVNEPLLCYKIEEVVAQFGAPAEGENAHDYTLYEFADLYFNKYKVAPVVLINVFDPARHTGNAEGSESPRPDVGKVTSKDIIGNIDPDTLRRGGLQLVTKIFPLFRMVPALILAPGFSADPEVALAIESACTSTSGFFTAEGIIDMPESIGNYTKAAAWLNDNNLTSEKLIAVFGSPTNGGSVQYGSSHLAGIMAARDAENDGIPYWSPSNYRMQAEGASFAGEDLNLTPEEAALLNGNGMVTWLNFIGGWVAWGNMTACYPGVTDVKDCSIPIRRMFNWVGNTLITNSWQKIDNPLNHRMIETVQETFNIWLNGLVGKGILLAGRVTFETTDNPTSDLMGGKVIWHVYLTPPNAAQELVFTLEYDPSALETLFG